MVGWGILLVVLGVGSLLLPMLNIQFTLMSFLDDYQPWAGIVVAIIGAGVIAWAMMKKRSTDQPGVAAQG